MTTPQVWITDVLIDLGKFDPEETPGAAYMSHGLRVLNRLAKSWATENLLIPYTISESFALTGAASYTMGTAGTASTIRANRILNAYVRDSGGLDTPVSVIDQRQYNAISDKSVGGTVDRIFYDPVYPVGVLYVWRLGTGTMFIESNKELTTALTLFADVSIPGEYEAALVANLRNALAGTYGVQVTNYMVTEADDLVRKIKNLNLANRMEEMDMPAGLPGVASKPWSIEEG